jgi:hypothetical protein
VTRIGEHGLTSQKTPFFNDDGVLIMRDIIAVA